MTFFPFLSLFFLLSWVYTFWYFQVNDSIPDELLRYGFSGFLTFIVAIIIIIIVDFFFLNLKLIIVVYSVKYDRE